MVMLAREKLSLWFCYMSVGPSWYLGCLWMKTASSFQICSKSTVPSSYQGCKQKKDYRREAAEMMVKLKKHFHLWRKKFNSKGDRMRPYPVRMLISPLTFLQSGMPHGIPFIPLWSCTHCYPSNAHSFSSCLSICCCSSLTVIIFDELHTYLLSYTYCDLCYFKVGIIPTFFYLDTCFMKSKWMFWFQFLSQSNCFVIRQLRVSRPWVPFQHSVLISVDQCWDVFTFAFVSVNFIRAARHQTNLSSTAGIFLSKVSVFL